MIQVFDNFLSQQELEEFTSFVYEVDFPWYRQKSIVDVERQDNYPPMLTHVVYDEDVPRSEAYDYVSNIFASKLKVFAWARIKFNLMLRDSKLEEHGYHIDLKNAPVSDYSKTALFYLNTNNGYTKFDTGEVISSIANRLVVFPSSIAHTGTSTTDSKDRVVLNMNYVEIG